MRRLVRQLLSILSVRQRKQVFLLLLALIIRAAVEVVGVASIAPFMRIAAEPDIIHRHKLLSSIYEWGSFANETRFLIAVGTGVIILLAVSNLFSALTSWAMYRFAWSANHQLSIRLLKGYLAQPYGFFVERNSASLHKNILSEVQSAIGGGLLPSLNFLAQGLVVLALAGMLILLDPVLATAIILALGGAYGVIYSLVRRRQNFLGREQVDANLLRFKVAGEAFGGVKDVKVLQREPAFLEQFAAPSKRWSQAMASNTTVSLVPRYLLETIAFGGILLIIILYLNAGKSMTLILPMVSLYTVAGYRLMPALQSLFAAAASIRFNRAALDDLCEDLSRFHRDAQETAHAHIAIPFANVIRFEDVSFTYPGGHACALNGVTVSLHRNQTIGLVGASGSGKTTFVDLLLGLYEPSRGHIAIDGVSLDAATIPGWRSQVGYVPQQIFLSDDTIAGNIAFGIPQQLVDQSKVEKAARIAHLHDFIQTLPNTYKTLVGERGVRLSGGQRQRIGIARALYNNPAVLIMDEATSALDGATEDAVMEAIRALAGSKTIILIAHRFTTVQECDCIYLLEHGRVVEGGTYTEMVARSAAFRAMAQLRSASEAASLGVS